MRKKFKVLIVDNSPAFTGAYKSISAITTALREDFDFMFCLPSGSSLKETSTKARPTITLPFSEIKKHVGIIFYLPLLISNSLRLLRVIRKNKIDILHINDLYNLVGVLVKMISPKTKVIYHVRLLPSSYAGPLYRSWVFLIKRYADYAVFVSQTVKDKFGACNGFHATISDAICLDDDIPLKSSPRKDQLQLLYLANYTQGKGHEDAIRAFSMALKENINLRLLFAGGDFGLRKNRLYKASLQRLAQHERVADRIVFDGFAERPATLFAGADMFLNFSRSESFSLTCLEALSHGVPVISTDSGGPAELLQSGISGILVPVGDVLAMSKAIVKLSTDHAYRTRLGANGKAYALGNRQLSKSANELKDVYLNLMSPFQT